MPHTVFPPGRYRVTLHFAEIEVKELELRYLDASLEGERVLPRHIPLRAGFAAAGRETFETEVRDGILDIEFAHRAREPIVTALEIEPVAKSEGAWILPAPSERPRAARGASCPLVANVAAPGKRADAAHPSPSISPAHHATMASGRAKVLYQISASQSPSSFPIRAR